MELSWPQNRAGSVVHIGSHGPVGLKACLGNSQCGDSGGGGGGVESDESGMDFTNRAKHDLLAYQRVEKTLEAFIMQSQICSFL